jgi:hypothetical protein
MTNVESRQVCPIRKEKCIRSDCAWWFWPNDNKTDAEENGMCIVYHIDDLLNALHLNRKNIC